MIGIEVKGCVQCGGYWLSIIQNVIGVSHVYIQYVISVSFSGLDKFSLNWCCVHVIYHGGAGGVYILQLFL